MFFRGLLCTLVLLLLLLGCEKHEVEVRIEGGGRAFSSAERRSIQEIADAAARDVRTLLPTLPRQLTLVVQSGKDVIPETGENGTTSQPGTVVWTIDPDRNVLATIRVQLRPTLFHELHHLVRGKSVPTRSLMDAVVTEGMATAFERDFGGARPLWADSPPEIAQWTEELLAQPATASHHDWLIRHPDGRRWIGMRVGTHLVDRAHKASGKPAADLVSMPTDDVLHLAGLTTSH